MIMLVLVYRKCSTCLKALKWLEDSHIAFEERPIVEQNPTYEELKEWHAKSGLPLKKFFNTSGLLYKEMNLKNKLAEMSEEEQLQLLATNGMLVKRPLVIGEDYVLTGFKESEWDSKMKLDDYAKPAKAQWGHTDAYKEYEEKCKGRIAEKENALGAGMMQIFAEFGEIRTTDPKSQEAQDLVKKLQNYITEHFYHCTNEILASLGQMYACGGEFTDNIDKAGGKGTAQFAADAISEYCK